MADPLLQKKSVIKVALETVKGTEVPGSQDILVSDADMKPEGEFEQRNGSGLFLGQTVKGVINGRSGSMTFGVEMRSGGAGVLEPGLAMLLQASAYAQTLQVYQVHSSFTAQKTISIDMYADGKIMTLYAAMGTYTIDAETGGRVMLNFTFTGIYKTPADIALPAFAPSVTSPMQFSNGVFTVGGTALPISKFTLDAGNVVIPRPDISGPGGVIHWLVTNYDPTVAFDPEADLVANNDFYGLWLAGTEAALILTIGDGATNVTISCPAIQYKEIPAGERDGISIHEIAAQCNNSAPTLNDQVIITAAAA